MGNVVSSIDGRLRVRSPRLRDPATLEKMRRTVVAWQAVRDVEVNVRTGSLLASYDAKRCGRSDFEARMEVALGKLPGAATEKKSISAFSGSARVRANRWAKRGMLASLGVSLALAAWGSKRWHVLSGVAFLHALGVHLWVHRRHLTR